MTTATRVALIATILLLLPAATCKTTVCPGPDSGGVIDIEDANCTQAATQPETGWVYFVCTVDGATGSTLPSFTVKVPAADATGFASARAPHAARPMRASDAGH